MTDIPKKNPSARPFQRPPRYTRRWPWTLAFIVAGLLVANYFFHWFIWPWEMPASPKAPVRTARDIQAPGQQVLDFGKIQDHSDPGLTDMVDRRKKEFGLRDSVDMVANEDETIKVGGQTITLGEILAEIRKQTGQEALPAGSALTARSPSELASEMADRDASGGDPANGSKVQYYGLYVVRSGDNLWDIHFTILREYLKHRHIDIAEDADVQTVGGHSSGVARILKYAEKMVHIFNVRTRTLDHNLNMLEPEEKVVIFNLTRLETILGSVTSENIDEIQYDGEDIFLPGEAPPPGDTG